MPHRYYVNTPLIEGKKVELEASELKHLKNVMRVKIGSEIEIVNGKGELGSAYFNKEITITNVIKEPTVTVKKTLALGLTEPKILELVIEKLTELGIDQVYIFPSSKSKLKELSDNKKLRLHKILISSLKQSKRLFLPKIHYLNKKEDLPKNQHYLLGDFNGDKFSPTNKDVTFIIGPESGFTKEEIVYFKENLNAKGIILSKNVLRAETAAICAACFLAL